MNSKSRLAAIATVAAIPVATPALAVAQGLQTGTAENREQLHRYGSSSPGYVPYYSPWAYGLGANAEVPGSPSVAQPYGYGWQ